MNTLVLGIDGGDEEIVRSMRMDKLTEILDKSRDFDVTEDLWNRGWASILSGAHGKKTGAFYEKPVFDGDYSFTQKFGTEDYEDNDDLIPLWERLNNLGYSTGFLNAPTTMPAPKVDGFFISGAGAGYDPAGGVPEVGCFPKKIHNRLDDYVWEARFGSYEANTAGGYLDLLETAIKQRTDHFIELVREFDVDVGFLVHKEFALILYLAMSEVEEYLEENSVATRFQRGIQDFYHTFDESVRKVAESLDPDDIVVCSDHSQSPYYYSANVDEVLLDNGYQTKESGGKRALKKKAKSIGHLLPTRVKNMISNNASSIKSEITSRDLHWEETKAFGHRYVPGIYLNDNRFGQPNVDEDDKQYLVQSIIREINNSPEAREYNMNARVYRAKHSEEPFSDLLPDIWIDSPNWVFFEGSGNFVQKNPYYESVEPLRDVQRDMHTGTKGSRPLLHTSYDDIDVTEQQDKNLCLAYDVIMQTVTA